MGGKPAILLLFAAVSGIISVTGARPFYYKDFGLYRQTGEKFASLGKPEADDIRTCTKSKSDLECVEWGESKNTLKVTAVVDNCIIKSYDVAADVVLAPWCINLGSFHWYGGGEEKHQYWPLEAGPSLTKPMVPVELESRAIADALWYSSEGDLIFVDKGSPIFYSLNKTSTPPQICLRGSLEPPYRPRARLQFSVNYCKFTNPKEAYQHAIENFISKPSGYPDERMIAFPIWSTWAQYARDINDSAVRDFANQIKDNDFNNSQLEIDDRWETCYGSTTFDTTRFPDMKGLSDYLHNTMGFRVTLWSHFFIELSCDAINEALKDDYLVPNLQGVTASKWWNGNASVVDMTNADAKAWWVNKHKKMMEDNGIDGMKFDAGETSWLPQLPKLNIKASNTEDYPGQFTVEYVRACATFGGITEFRSAHYTQDLPIFIRMLDKDSKWGYDNGLKTLVTTLLQMNAIGYSLVLPDMIGGNAYNGDVITDELFIRWVQANAFMPAMQFSVIPWKYANKKVAELSRTFAALHYEYSGTIIEAMKQSVKDGTPVNPPLWWLSPNDNDAQSLDSEFLLGENIVVAPVLDPNVYVRDVYLPDGIWRDGNNMNKVYNGSQWIKNYAAPIEILPYFIRDGYVPPAPYSPTESAASTVVLSVSLLVLAPAILMIF